MHGVSSRHGGVSRKPFLLFGLLIAAAVALDLLFFSRTLDDAFITFRYARHLAEGYGLGAYNTDGTRVEGYTTLSWMLLLAGGERLGINCYVLSKTLGIASHLALVSLLFWQHRLAGNPLSRNHVLLRDDGAAGKLAAAFVALYLPVVWYASSGMETVPFALLVGIAVVTASIGGRRGNHWLTVASVLLVVTRPEGALVALMCQGSAILDARRRRHAVGTAVVGAGAAVAVLIALLALRLAVYGEWLPNTYYAKAAGAPWMHLRYGIHYVASYAIAHLPVCVPIIGLTFWAISRPQASGARWLRFVLLLLGIYLIYVLIAGGDNVFALPGWRHLVHVVAPIALLSGIAVNRFLGRSTALQALAVGAGLLTAALGSVSRGPIGSDLQSALVRPFTLSYGTHSAYYTWIAELTGPSDTIATSLGGELPFVVDCTVIDMLGLNDHHIAHYGVFDPAGPIDSKTDMRYVVARRPDIIEGYVSGTGILNGIPREQLVGARREQMLLSMLGDPVFQDDYLFLMNGPYQYMDRALFLRRDYWERHPRKARLRCIPVTETSLYSSRPGAKPEDERPSGARRAAPKEARYCVASVAGCRSLCPRRPTKRHLCQA